MTDHDFEAQLGGLATRGDVLLDKYRLERFIGGGAMGAVIEAWHQQLHERVAIKVLTPSLVGNSEAHARFRREARLLFKIKSEHVCRVLDVGELAGGVPFMVMEYLEGHDLGSELAERKTLPIGEAVQWILEACSGIAQAHARGIVHRDLKPENLFLAVGPDGKRRVKLLDFGLSKEWAPVPGEAKRERKLTAVDQTMGTPSYMSPEMWLSVTDAGPAADQWALGAILFELLGGTPPFTATSIAKLCSAILEASPPSLKALRPEVPAGLEAVVAKSLEKHPHDRYENVGALALAVSAFGEPGAAAEAERTSQMLERAAAELETPVRGMSLPLRSPHQSSDMNVTRKDLGRSAHSKGAMAAALAAATTPAGDSGQSEAQRSRATIVGVVATALLVGLLVLIFSTGSDPVETRTPHDAAVGARPLAETAPPEVASSPPVEPASSSAPAISSGTAAVASAELAPPPTASERSAPAPSPKVRKKQPGLFDERAW